MNEQDRLYVQRHFWPIEELAQAVGVEPRQALALIEAGCAPGPIYVLSEEGWWSALDSDLRPQGESFYSPGAAWWLRRSVLKQREGKRPEQVADELEEHFLDTFEQALARIEQAREAFPACFSNGLVDSAIARSAGKAEWGDWIEGGYGVCLRVFNGWNCVMKESLGAHLKAALTSGGHDPAGLLEIAEVLADILLPFAPWQRAGGTPGRTIDRLLRETQLGQELPYRSAIQQAGARGGACQA